MIWNRSYQNQEPTFLINFEQRTSLIKAWLKEEISPRFDFPRNQNAAMIARDTMETVNASLPNCADPQAFGSLLEGVKKHLVERSTSRTLPPPKYFIDACKMAVQKSSGGNISEVSDKVLDVLVINAKRIKAGEPVSEHWLTDRGRKLLITKAGLTAADFKKYGDFS